LLRLILLISTLLFVTHSLADDWVCPNPGDDFCDSYHAEFILKQTDKYMNQIYKQLLTDYKTKKERQPTINAQRAWLKYVDAHCYAVQSKFNGATFTMAEMESSCRTQQINRRIEELKGYCESCN
jgi:uncharacterized protein YecT (DUF1311 family)